MSGQARVDSPETLPHVGDAGKKSKLRPAFVFEIGQAVRS